MLNIHSLDSHLLPENADCCLADLLFVSTGVILPVREAKLVLLTVADLASSSGVTLLLMVFPYRSSMLRSQVSHMALNVTKCAEFIVTKIPLLFYELFYFSLSHFLAPSWVQLVADSGQSGAV